METAITYALNVVRSTDRVTGTFAFIGFLFVFFLGLIYFYAIFDSSRKPAKKVRRRCAVHDNSGKRSSMRLRLRKHELVFIERISPEEFEAQKGEYT